MKPRPGACVDPGRHDIAAPLGSARTRGRNNTSPPRQGRSMTEIKTVLVTAALARPGPRGPAGSARPDAERTLAANESLRAQGQQAERRRKISEEGGKRGHRAGRAAGQALRATGCRKRGQRRAERSLHRPNPFRGASREARPPAAAAAARRSSPVPGRVPGRHTALGSAAGNAGTAESSPSWAQAWSASPARGACPSASNCRCPTWTGQ